MHTDPISILTGASRPSCRQRDQAIDVLDALAAGLMGMHGLDDRIATVNDAIAAVEEAPTEPEALAAAEACVLGLLRAPAGDTP